MVCDATYKKIKEAEEELEEAIEQRGFKDEREYLEFLLAQEKEWEREHTSELVPEGKEKK